MPENSNLQWTYYRGGLQQECDAVTGRLRTTAKYEATGCLENQGRISFWKLLRCVKREEEHEGN